jgi:phenylalanyl-tRNA synthetase alpha chain
LDQRASIHSLTLRSLIHSAFPGFQHVSPGSPLVTPYQNFDSLSFAPDHPGRSRSDTYYVNKDLLLRTHISAHEVEIFKSGSDRWTLTADMYRRDEIDSSHYPVFHQTEGARTFDLSVNTMNALRGENAALSAKLSEMNIIFEDVPYISPVQNGHNAEHVALIAHNLKLHINQMLLALFGPLVAITGEPLRVRWIEAFFPFTSPSFEVKV